MIKVLYGEKGTGKTKSIINAANEMVISSKGDVVFIDDDNSNMYNLKHEIRFINTSEFEISGSQMFLGFLCGIISEDYDISGIFIDGLAYILNTPIEQMENFFQKIKWLSDKYEIEFLITINGGNEVEIDFLKPYLQK